jgi:hypothetical protein
VKLMLLPPLADLITSLADMPFSRQSQKCECPGSSRTE